MVTDDQTANAAVISDSGAKNSWGISFAAGSPFWVSANGSGVSNVYQVNPTTNVPTKLGLTVTIPGDGSVTGQLSNSNSAAFNGDVFLFASE
ncbi:MAG TPA: PEP-CTERM sorting domain-containing protein, partial [Terriglobia bacterium]|nr:PEP-CTERM sorting domain-containing protein [Terriglobia bacterium]